LLFLKTCFLLIIINRPKRPQEVSYKPIVKNEISSTGAAVSQSQPISSIGIPRVLRGPDLTLNGIMYLEEGPRAIINNFIVEIGDFVSGAKVTRINRQSVILEYENVEITLSLV
jgi:hypothetical protein